MRIEFDLPSLIIGIILVIISVAYWDVDLVGIPVPKILFAMGFFLIVWRPFVTLLTGDSK